LGQHSVGAVNQYARERYQYADNTEHRHEHYLCPQRTVTSPRASNLAGAQDAVDSRY
jgi:hypothetical protein